MNTQPDALPVAATDRFIEQMGLSVEADGLPRIAGRMWGYFIIYGGPVSFAELADRLLVSRGSISTNARLLRDLGIIERVGLPGDRQDYYQLADQPYDRLLVGYVERMRARQRDAHAVLSALDAGAPDGARARLAQMQGFYHSAVGSTENLIATLRDQSAVADSENRQ